MAEPIFVEWVVRGESPPHPMDTSLDVLVDEDGEERDGWRGRLVKRIEREMEAKRHA